MAVVYPGGFHEDGVGLGNSGGKIGFFGTAPIAKPTVTTVTTAAQTTTLLETRVNRLSTALAALGLVSFS